MNTKELIKADSETFWKYWAKTAPKRGTPVNIVAEEVKGTGKKGKNKGPS